MATPKFDRICEAFLKRVPDSFATAFTPGGGAMPAGNLIPAANISDYVNKALHYLLAEGWNKAAELSGGELDKQIKYMMRLFPELVKTSASVALSSGDYTIANPYLDFHRLVGGNIAGAGGKKLRIWPEEIYNEALEGKYLQYIATTDDPAVIQISNKLAVFPRTGITNITFVYIKAPLLTTTGGFLAQNGAEDSPFYDGWTDRLADIALSIYQKENYNNA